MVLHILVKILGGIWAIKQKTTNGGGIIPYIHNRFTPTGDELTSSNSKVIYVADCHFLPFKKSVFYCPTLRRC
jgi:hypothetical protein